MSWVLIYIATHFLALIPLISTEIVDFFTSISAQIDEHLAQDFSKKSEPAKAEPQTG
jgi:hypothetical protein